jgi:glycosyltransferase involved in cell wall biosynthesis
LTEKVKITCIIHSLCGGGAERVMAGLASRLLARGHEIVLLTLDDGQSDRYEIPPRIRRVCLNLMGESRGWMEKLTSNRARVQGITDALKTDRPDVVLSFCDRTNITVLLATRRLGIPVVISERSDPAKQRLGFFWELARRRAYPLASRIIALTETSANHLQPFNARPVVVIPSAVDPPKSFSDRDRAAENKCVMGAGRLEYEKGFDRLIEAFDLATVDHPEWTLRILGDGSLRSELEEIAVTLAISDRVQLPGWVRPIWPDLSEATIFALPSRYEGFPSALVEAMAAGVPCVSVDCESGPRAIIRHQVNGLLVRNSNEELAAGIRRLIDDAELRETIAEAGKSVIGEFSWEKMTDAYENVIHDVLVK